MKTRVYVLNDTDIQIRKFKTWKKTLTINRTRPTQVNDDF